MDDCMRYSLCEEEQRSQKHAMQQTGGAILKSSYKLFEYF